MSKVDVAPISQPIVPRKQAAKRHYGSHPYFTKRAWNVVQKYIECFSEPGDLVLDPYGGSGVTAVEALVLKRRAIHMDLAPLANFITWGVAVAPVDLDDFKAMFFKLRDLCSQEINALYDRTAAEIDAMPIPYWYPQGVALPSDSDVPTVEAVFHRRSLIGLSILFHHISAIPDDTMRELYRLVFSATLVKTNLTFSSTTGRLESRGDSGIFRVYRYWVPPVTVELNVWEQFEHRYKGWVNAKRETNQLIGDYFKLGDTIKILRGTATDMSSEVESESIDYIYTDPPYGAHIAYLDLMTMWNAWLGFDVTLEDRKLEVIEGGELDKSKDEYTTLLHESITEMFRVLKWDSWLSIVFAHKDPAYWDAIVKAAQDAGFEYVNTAVQPSTTPSLHKRKNPLKVLSGELVLNFRKVKSPNTIAITALGQDAVQLVKNQAELVIVRNHGATTEEIYNDLVPVLLENGLLSVVKKQVPDVTGLFHEEFDYSPVDGRWHIRENTKLGSFIPIKDRIRFYVTDYLRRRARDGKQVTFDDIIFSVMPNLINGKTPSKQTILRVLDDIAYSVDKTHWALQKETVEPTGSQTALTFEAATPIPLLVTPLSISHDEVIYRLSKLAAASGLKPHVGKKEQASSMLVYGERLATIGGGKLPASLTMKGKWEKGKVEQIDCIFFHPLGVPMYAFEVEASTPITTGIDRFIELLPFNEKLARRLVLVIPKAREKKLNAILRDSHYIGHPMYMENKLTFLFYDDLIKLYDSYAGKKPPSSDALLSRLDEIVRLPELD